MIILIYSNDSWNLHIKNFIQDHFTTNLIHFHMSSWKMELQSRNQNRQIRILYFRSKNCSSTVFSIIIFGRKGTLMKLMLRQIQSDFHWRSKHLELTCAIVFIIN